MALVPERLPRKFILRTIRPLTISAIKYGLITDSRALARRSKRSPKHLQVDRTICSLLKPPENITSFIYALDLCRARKFLSQKMELTRNNFHADLDYRIQFIF